MSPPVLYQFRVSHFVEKVRWTLDLKGIAHERRTVMAGQHIPVMFLVSGQRMVPALRLDGEMLVGSAHIIEALESRVPEPRLLPDTDQARAEAAALISWLDNRVGPDIRRALYFEILPHPTWVSRLFSAGRPAWVQRLYSVAFRGVVPVMRRMMRIYPAESARSLARLDEALDRIATLTAATGYLVGDRFTVADLTAASLLYPLVLPAEYPYPVPQPMPEAVHRWLARRADHPAAAWVREIYRRHRPPSRAINEAPPASA